jgi:RNA polymerase sigma factor (sigma-70 family)
VASPPGDRVLRLISGIRQEDAAAWEEFIAAFAPHLLQAARAIERDRDHAADAFVFICEGLRKRRGARLASYDPARPGSFETWLKTVATNLARDARRARLGRFRTLASIGRLSPLEQRVFQLQYEQGFSFHQMLAVLSPEFSGLTEGKLAEAETQVRRRVSAADRFRIIHRRPQFVSVEEPDGPESAVPRQFASAAPDPEGVALMREVRRQLSAALATLTVEDRLLVQLHFERNVTLAKLAVSFGFSSPQAVHRRLKDVLDGLRKSMGERV